MSQAFSHSLICCCMSCIHPENSSLGLSSLSDRKLGTMQFHQVLSFPHLTLLSQTLHGVSNQQHTTWKELQQLPYCSAVYVLTGRHVTVIHMGYESHDFYYSHDLSMLDAIACLPVDACDLVSCHISC